MNEEEFNELLDRYQKVLKKAKKLEEEIEKEELGLTE